MYEKNYLFFYIIIRCLRLYRQTSPGDIFQKTKKSRVEKCLVGEIQGVRDKIPEGIIFSIFKTPSFTLSFLLKAK